MAIGKIYAVEGGIARQDTKRRAVRREYASPILKCAQSKGENVLNIFCKMSVLYRTLLRLVMLLKTCFLFRIQPIDIAKMSCLLFQFAAAFLSFYALENCHFPESSMICLQIVS